ncbi:MAG TPA: hypothetical protein VGN64_08855 [Dyadobacter sp.]|jgi:hypothetical protein|nr:hypothetical protein [Dyadobacter sp.]
MKDLPDYLSQQKNFIFLLVILSILSADSYADLPYPIGARSWGIANASVARRDYSYGFVNMAALGGVRETSAFSSYSSHFGFEGIGTFAAGAIMPVHDELGMAVTVQRFGDKLYNQSAIGIAAGHQIGRFSLGLKANYLQHAISAPSLSFSRRAVVFEFGGIVTLSSRLFFGAHVFNLTQSSYSGGYGRRVPTVLRAGFTYQPQSNLTLSAEMEKDTDQPLAFKTGLEYKVWKQLFLRTGVASRPLTSHFGAGFKARSYLIDYAVHTHTQLGLSHHLSLGYVFAERKPKSEERK